MECFSWKGSHFGMLLAFEPEAGHFQTLEVFRRGVDALLMPVVW
jgi:hypothetical protein